MAPRQKRSIWLLTAWLVATSVWQNVIFHLSESGMRPVRRSMSLYCRELRPLLIFRGLFGGLSFDQVNGADGRLLAKVKLLSPRVALFALLRAIDVTLAATFLIKIHKVSHRIYNTSCCQNN
jgi:hypothetical protein